uniref:Protein crumbs homolog 3 isoform X2 n=1 Tax=Phascolarctos cinereus TaxID=38626 RepID=A0A6P5J7E9_PHACI|nr:protein crumbs homolog 3 isoform X2 [Phascolarctos cinereus]
MRPEERWKGPFGSRKADMLRTGETRHQDSFQTQKMRAREEANDQPGAWRCMISQKVHISPIGVPLKDVTPRTVLWPPYRCVQLSPAPLPGAQVHRQEVRSPSQVSD